MDRQYIPIMAKITRKATARKQAEPKKKAGTAAAEPRSRAKKPPPKAKLSKSKASKSKASKAKSQKVGATRPWTAAEIHEAFSRFRNANPEPKGELEHLNPFTLL